MKIGVRGECFGWSTELVLFWKWLIEVVVMVFFRREM